jgi:hypothetical protein
MMGAVDKKDMILSSIESVRKTVKWYKKFFFHVLDMCVFNAHILYCEVQGKKIPLAKFHHSLIQEMVERFASDRGGVGGRKSNGSIPMRLTGRHFPKNVISEACKTTSPRKTCRV